MNPSTPNIARFPNMFVFSSGRVTLDTNVLNATSAPTINDTLERNPSLIIR